MLLVCFSFSLVDYIPYSVIVAVNAELLEVLEGKFILERSLTHL